MTAHSRWMRAKLAEEIVRRGGYCQNVMCQFLDWQIQFAHLRPTGLKGRGRGRNKRILDIRRYPSAYALLCRDCHRAFDGGEELFLTVRQEATA